MKKTVGIILIILAIGLGYMGIKGVQESGDSVEILGIELSAENKQEKTTAYLELGGALALLLGGIYLVGKKKK